MEAKNIQPKPFGDLVAVKANTHGAWHYEPSTQQMLVKVAAFADDDTLLDVKEVSFTEEETAVWVNDEDIINAAIVKANYLLV